MYGVDAWSRGHLAEDMRASHLPELMYAHAYGLLMGGTPGLAAPLLTGTGQSETDHVRLLLPAPPERSPTIDELPSFFKDVADLRVPVDYHANKQLLGSKAAALVEGCALNNLTRRLAWLVLTKPPHATSEIMTTKLVTDFLDGTFNACYTFGYV